MRFELPTLINHGLTAPDGTKRLEHCCGCWNIVLDEQASWPVHARCNECGEIREIGHSLEDIH